MPATVTMVILNIIQAELYEILINQYSTHVAVLQNFASFTAANLRFHQVYSFFQPGKLGFGVIDGKGYVISADTGKTKSYTTANQGYDFTDAVRARVAYTGNSCNQYLVFWHTKCVLKLSVTQKPK